jgi:hypothetical protein
MLMNKKKIVRFCPSHRHSNQKINKSEEFYNRKTNYCINWAIENLTPLRLKLKLKIMIFISYMFYLKSLLVVSRQFI